MSSRRCETGSSGGKVMSTTASMLPEPLDRWSRCETQRASKPRSGRRPGTRVGSVRDVTALPDHVDNLVVGAGFAGIAVALLGRNNPLGIAAGALIFAYLSEQANPLGILAGISPEIVAVTQGVVVLCVVIAYEVVRRYRNRLEQRSVAEALEAGQADKEVSA